MYSQIRADALALLSSIDMHPGLVWISPCDQLAFLVDPFFFAPSFAKFGVLFSVDS
jgi:hypothetical protein